MNITVAAPGKSISVSFRQHGVSIYTNNELTSLLASDAVTATDELVTEIKKEYYNLFNHDFDVTDHSFAVEIWGHVYADKFADWIKSISDISFVDSVADKIIYHAEKIDIGELGYDSNRFVWNGLAAFKPLIARFLP